MNRRKPYHHGNLREALLEASIQLIAEIGPSAFTLREVARRAGVSHNAPYRHFHDKGDLLAAVAAQGYSELTDGMLQAANRHSDARDRLKHAGLADRGGRGFLANGQRGEAQAVRDLARKGIRRAREFRSELP